jgi:hypothetical protein
VLEPHRKEEILLLPNVLHSLVKYAEEGEVEVHKPMVLDFTLMDLSLIGAGSLVVYKTTIRNEIFALKVLQLHDRSPVEDQKKLFRREIALMRYILFTC